MNHANYYASFLVKLFAIFETMPVASFFDGFRLATGNASAIQSQKYQLMDRITRGFGEQKRASLKLQPEGRSLADWNLPLEWGLSGLASALRSRESEKSEGLLTQIEELDRLLHMWRAKHLGIARRYLPPDTRGTGDEGVSYLESNVRSPMIRVDAGPTAPNEEGRFRVTAAVQISAKHVQFHWCELSEVDGAAVAQAMQAQRAESNQAIAKRQEELEESSRVYQQFFADHQRTCPLVRQFKKAVASGVPTSNVVSELLLSIECGSGTLVGVFDIRMLVGPLRLDVAVDGESFDSIVGTPVRCRSGDWVMRDAKSIFASYFDGPDRRTALDPARLSKSSGLVDVAFMIFGAPSLSPECYELARLEVQNRVSKFAKESRWWSWTL
jgi:DNA/RNA-binding domain of Phe-tRNA-synthetase-like protein